MAAQPHRTAPHPVPLPPTPLTTASASSPQHTTSSTGLLVVPRLASGPLHWLYPPPGMLSPHIPTWLPPSFPSDFHSNSVHEFSYDLLSPHPALLWSLARAASHYSDILSSFLPHCNVSSFHSRTDLACSALCTWQARSTYLLNENMPWASPNQQTSAARAGGAP